MKKSWIPSSEPHMRRTISSGNSFFSSRPAGAPWRNGRGRPAPRRACPCRDQPPSTSHEPARAGTLTAACEHTPCLQETCGFCVVTHRDDAHDLLPRARLAGTSSVGVRRHVSIRWRRSRGAPHHRCDAGQRSPVRGGAPRGAAVRHHLRGRHRMSRSPVHRERRRPAGLPVPAKYGADGEADRGRHRAQRQPRVRAAVRRRRCHGRG